VRLNATLDPAAASVEIRVQDTGIGIRPELLPRIFDMFTQGDQSLERPQGGLGIGLTLVRELVALHDGSVAAHSAGLGKGSEFLVRLPIATGPAPTAAPAPQAISTKTPVGRRILVVDDNTDSADSLAALLRLEGHEVQTAYDGAAGVEAATAYCPDVVLLDIGLPRLNGYDAARHIRRLPGGGDILLVALTGWGQEEDRRRSRDAGFDLHLVKPVDPVELQDILNEGRKS
jgi:CheY-like chemotaxis protein